jgi:hypothetical protein
MGATKQGANVKRSIKDIKRSGVLKGGATKEEQQKRNGATVLRKRSNKHVKRSSV